MAEAKHPARDGQGYPQFFRDRVLRDAAEVASDLVQQRLAYAARRSNLCAISVSLGAAGAAEGGNETSCTKRRSWTQTEGPSGNSVGSLHKYACLCRFHDSDHVCAALMQLPGRSLSVMSWQPWPITRLRQTFTRARSTATCTNIVSRSKQSKL